jgi:TolB-like protein/DNA-binding protein YbaB
MQNRDSIIYQFGLYTINILDRTLRLSGNAVPLTPKAFDVLLLLIQNRGHIVEKSHLLSTIWPDSFVEEGNLTYLISVLRKALGEKASKVRYIETVPKHGYKFIAEVIESKHKDSRRSSIAVLPFKLIGSVKEEEYLGAGIADALITNLSNIRQITVRPTSSILKYTDYSHGLQTIGTELNVDLILDGTIQQSEDRIRVTVQLVDVNIGTCLWADKFDESFTNVFSIQDSISEYIVHSLMLRLTQEEQHLMTKRHTPNIEAYRAYMKGRYYWNKRSEGGLNEGIKYFNIAIKLDSLYARAYSGLADCYNLVSLYSGIAPNESFPKAKEAAIKAIELDGSLAEAYASLAYSQFCHEYNWIESEKRFKRAIDLDPNNARVHQWYSNLLTGLGAFEDALIQIKEAQRLDPSSVHINLVVGWTLHFARQYEKAVEQLKRTLWIDPNYGPTYWVLGLSYTQMGMYKEAMEAFEKMIKQKQFTIAALAGMGNVYAVLRDTVKAVNIINELIDYSKDKYVPAYYIATIYAGLKKEKEAIAWLQRAYEDRSDWLVYLNVDPNYDWLRSNTGFTQIIKQIELSSIHIARLLPITDKNTK